jgi:hypothetical protein
MIWVAIAVAVLVAGSVSPARSGIRTERRASALFLLEERRGGTPFIFVVAGELSAGYFDVGLGRGLCTGDDIPEDCTIDRSRSFARELRDGETFEIDPMLETAHLRVRLRNQIHEVTWTGDGVPAPLQNDHECAGAPAGEVGVRRPASASGRVFGQRVTAAVDGLGEPWLQAAAYGC